jgi:hypothetical protein
MYSGNNIWSVYLILVAFGIGIALLVSWIIWGDSKPEPTVVPENEWCLVGFVPAGGGSDEWVVPEGGMAELSIVMVPSGYELYQKCGKIE